MEEFVSKKGPNLKTIILCFNSINNLDSSAIHILEELIEDYKIQDIALLFTGVRGPLRDVMEKSHLIEKVGVRNFFMITIQFGDLIGLSRLSTIRSLFSAAHR